MFSTVIRIDNAFRGSRLPTGAAAPVDVHVVEQGPVPAHLLPPAKTPAKERPEPVARPRPPEKAAPPKPAPPKAKPVARARTAHQSPSGPFVPPISDAPQPITPPPPVPDCAAGTLAGTPVRLPSEGEISAASSHSVWAREFGLAQPPPVPRETASDRRRRRRAEARLHYHERRGTQPVVKPRQLNFQIAEADLASIDEAAKRAGEPRAVWLRRVLRAAAAAERGE